MMTEDLLDLLVLRGAENLLSYVIEPTGKLPYWRIATLLSNGVRYESY
jgi:hypothetical protein